MRPVEDGKVSPKPRITLASKALGGIIEGDDGAGLGLGTLFLAAAAVIAASPCRVATVQRNASHSVFSLCWAVDRGLAGLACLLAILP